YIGAILDRGELGVEASGDDDLLFGTFADRVAACKAVSERWEIKLRANGGDPTAAEGANPQPSAKPVALKPNFDGIPLELRERPNWLLWRYERTNPKKSKWDKVPYQTNGYKASTTNPPTWNTFEACRTTYLQGGYDGVGFVFDGEVGSDGCCLIG